jgi:hypothetical protein
MRCETCTTDDGKGMHFHAFIPTADPKKPKHKWVCEKCKAALKITGDHDDE